MNQKKVLFSVVIIAITIFAFLAWALEISTSISNGALVSPVAAANLSGTIILNISAAHNLSAAANISNVTLTFFNATNATKQDSILTVSFNSTDRVTNFTFADTSSVISTNSFLGLSDGRYNLSFILRNNSDGVDLTNSTPLRIGGVHDSASFVVIDNTRPLVQAVNQTNSSIFNFTSNSNVTLLITATNFTAQSHQQSGTGLHRVTVMINNGSNGTVIVFFNQSASIHAPLSTRTVWNLTFNHTAFIQNDGNYSFTVYANDTAGNENGSVQSWFVIDNSAPNTVELRNITEGLNTSDNTPEFVWAVNDSVSEVMFCDLYINRIQNATNIRTVNSSRTNYTIANANAMADGYHNWSVQCNNSVRLQNISALQNFTVDTARPLVRAINFTNGSAFNFTTNNNVSLIVTATNNTGLGDLVSGTQIHRVTIQIANKSNGTQEIFYNFTAVNHAGLATVWNISFNQSNYTKNDGNYSFTVYVNDTAGNENSSVTGWFVVDSTAPVSLDLRNITEGLNTSDTTPEFVWAVNDSLSEVMFCDLYVDRVQNVTNIRTVNSSRTNYTIAAANAMADGLHNWSIQCNDSVRLQIAGQRNFTVDTIRPLVRAVNQTNSSAFNFTTNNNVSLIVTATNNTGLGNANSGTQIHQVNLQINNLTNGTNLLFNLTAVNHGGLATVWNISFNQSNYTKNDGNYSFTVYVNDTAGNENSSVTGWFVVDTTAPVSLDLRNITEGLNTSDTTPEFVWAVNDSLSEVMFCDLYVDRVQNVTNIRSVNNTKTNYTIANIMADGAHNWSIQCNDSVRLQIAGQRNFTVDTTGPTVSLSKSAGTTTSLTIAVSTTSDALTCTTSRAGATVSNGPGSSQTVTESGLTAGTSYTYVVSCTDTAGNSGSHELAVATSSVDSSGSGGGGSGGGSSTGVQSQFEKRVWTSILAGEKASVALKNGVLGVTEVSFVVEKTTYGAWVNVNKVDALPSTVKAFGSKAYKTIEITQSNVEKVLSGSVLVDFKVEKAWYKTNGVSNDQIALFRYVDSKWVELKTTQKQDDGTYVHYTAETPGFSYFVIGKKAGAAAPSADADGSAEAVAPSAPVEDGGEAAGEAPVVEDEGMSPVVWVIVGLVLLGILAWVVSALRRR